MDEKLPEWALKEIMTLRAENSELRSQLSMLRRAASRDSDMADSYDAEWRIHEAALGRRS